MLDWVAATTTGNLLGSSTWRSCDVDDNALEQQGLAEGMGKGGQGEGKARGREGMGKGGQGEGRARGREGKGKGGQGTHTQHLVVEKTRRHLERLRHAVFDHDDCLVRYGGLVPEEKKMSGFGG